MFYYYFTEEYSRSGETFVKSNIRAKRNKNEFPVEVELNDHQGPTIDDNSIVAAGSVVIKDVPSHVIVAGNPAKKLRDI